MHPSTAPNLPYELLLLIISDVLANFLHLRVFLPPRNRDWDAVMTLSLVSKGFARIIDSIWSPAVGSISTESGHNWRKDVSSLRRAINTGDSLDLVLAEPAKPLLSAYEAHIMGLLIEQDRRNIHRLTKNYLHYTVEDRGNPESWYLLALRIAGVVHPTELSYVICIKVEECLAEHRLEKKAKEIKNKGYAWHMASRTGFSTTEQALTFGCSWFADIESEVKRCPSLFRYLEQSFMHTLREARDKKQSTLGNEPNSNLIVLQQQMSTHAATILRLWQDRNQQHDTHMRQMRAKVIYGIKEING